MSPFVDKGTRDKVHVVGSGKYMQVGGQGGLKTRSNQSEQIQPEFAPGSRAYPVVCVSPAGGGSPPTLAKKPE